MAGKRLKTTGKAFGDRLLGDGAGPLRAAVAAAIGSATAALTFHLLRTTEDDFVPSVRRAAQTRCSCIDLAGSAGVM